MNAVRGQRLEKVPRPDLRQIRFLLIGGWWFGAEDRFGGVPGRGNPFALKNQGVKSKSPKNKTKFHEHGQT